MSTGLLPGRGVGSDGDGIGYDDREDVVYVAGVNRLGLRVRSTVREVPRRSTRCRVPCWHWSCWRCFLFTVALGSS
jgi:hypothetical protein